MSATPISVPVSVIWTVRSTGQSAEATPATPLQVSVAQVHIGLKGAQGLQGLQGLQGYKGDKGDKGDTGDVTPAAEAARDAAQGARDVALTHAGTAGEQAVVATTKAGEAAASVVLADAARDAAFVNANVYADVATGLAAVADGVQFQVVSADGLSIQRWRRDAGPVAVLTATYPSAAINKLIGLVVDSTGAAFLDESGFAALTVDKDTGEVRIGLLSAKSFTPEEITLSNVATPVIADGDPAFELIDEDGFIGLRVSKEGLLYAVSPPSADSFSTEVLDEEPLQSVVSVGGVTAIPWFGQSNSMGWGATVLLSTVQPYQNVMYSGGALVPLVSTDWERPHVTAANYCTTGLLKSEGQDPSDTPLVAYTAGSGGASITALMAGGSVASALGNIRTVDATATAPLINFVQGETDTESGMSGATWSGHMETLRTNVQAQIQALTGNTDPLHVVLTQPAFKVSLSGAVVLAQCDLAKINPLYFMVCPMYRMPYAPDNVHLTNVGFKLMGAYFGRANAAILRGKRPQWLRPVSAMYSGDSIVVKFAVPVAPLRLNTVDLAPTLDSGFRITEGGVTKGISAVTVSAADEVTILCASTLSGDVVVRYALDYLGAGLTIQNGASGNLCDSNTEEVSINGTAYTLFDAAPHFQLQAYSAEV